MKPQKLYYYRIESNLIHGDIGISDTLAGAKKAIKTNKCLDYCIIEGYEYCVGKNELPVPNEIVEVTMTFSIRRYKIKK